MQAAVEAGAPAAVRPAIAAVQAPVALACAVVLVLAVFASGGSGDPGLVPIGVISLGVVGALVALALANRVPLARVGASGAALLAVSTLSTLWIGLSIAWSIEPDRSWSVFNRSTAYIALLGLGILLAGLVPRAPRLLALALAACLGAAALWALASVVVPALGPDLSFERSARLREPVGYWNALALLLAMSVPLWLWAATRATQQLRARAAAVSMLVPVLVGIALTSSRGGIVVTAAAAGAWLALGSPRLESAVALALALVAAVPAAWWGLAGSDLGEARIYDGRQLDGLVLAALVVAGAVGAGVLGSLLARRSPAPEERRRAERVVVAAAAALAVSGAVVAVVFGDLDRRLEEFRNPPSVQVQQGPGRLGSFSSNHRWTWWGEAWRIGRTHALEGTGAGSFELARRPLREDTEAPLAPHNVALQAFAETGAVGLALLLAVAGAAVAVVIAALRRLEGEERVAAVALTALCAAYAAHSLIDMGPEYVAVSAPFLLALGVLVSAGRGARVRGRAAPLFAVGAAVAALTLIVSLALPWLAERRLDDAVDAVAARELGRADERAEAAHELNPLAVEPLLLRAAVAEALGRADRAERFYVDAANLQPENPDTWYELGRFTFRVRRNPARALVYLDRSYAIDNFHPEGPRLLNEVRAALEGR